MGHGDKRKHERISFFSDFTLTVAGKATKYDEMDISMGGVFVATAAPMPTGTHGTFSFNLYSGETPARRITGDFEVVNTSSKKGRAGMGLKFTGMDSDSSLELYKVIRYNQPDRK